MRLADKGREHALRTKDTSEREALLRMDER